MPIQLVFAGLDVPALASLAWPALTVASLAPLHFAYEHFGLTPRRRWAWWWLLGLTSLATLVWPPGFDLRSATVSDVVNLVLCGRAGWLLADFGIARMGVTDGDGAGLDLAAGEVASPALTRTGEIMGTPLYIAPEIVSDREPFRPPADVFSLAVLAYEVLSRRHPFGIPPALFLRRGETLPVPEPIAGVDAAASEAIRAGLAREPARRPQRDAIRAALASARKA